MLTNNMKAYELNEMEMNEAVGCGCYHQMAYNSAQQLADMMNEHNVGEKQDEAFCNAVSTAYKVVKYVLFG